MVPNWVTWENCLRNWVSFFVQGPLFSSILDKRMQKKELYQPAVSFDDQCAQFARINAGAPVYMGICGTSPVSACIFVILPVFWWFSAGFNTLLSCLANRSLTL